MKIIQSFWPKPFISRCHYGIENSNINDILKKNIDYYNLSARIFKNIGYNIEIFTDEQGAELFKNNNEGQVIRKDLEKINGDKYSPNLWSFSKLYSLYLAAEDYNNKIIHVDNDIFFKDIEYIKNKIMSNWEILVQSKEDGVFFNRYYKRSIEGFCDIFKLDLYQRLDLTTYNYAYNCGFLGFKNREYIIDFYTKYKNFYDIVNQDKIGLEKYLYLKNMFAPIHFLDGIKININCILEQSQIVNFCNNRNLYVQEILPKFLWPNLYNGYCLNDIPKIGYKHFAGHKKFIEKELYEKIFSEYNF